MYMQIMAGNTANLLFVLGVMLVFLVLAALYESWSLPLAVILVVPMCLLSSLAGLVAGQLPIDILAMVGLVLLVGLASKNAILIVEFARQQRANNVPTRDATLAACRLRLRPILMTSFAFILGVVPLVWTKGAGAEMRHALGTAVFSGMIGVTLFGIFLTPVFFYVLTSLGEMPHWATPAVRRFGKLLLLVLAFVTFGYAVSEGMKHLSHGPLARAAWLPDELPGAWINGVSQVPVAGPGLAAALSELSPRALIRFTCGGAAGIALLLVLLNVAPWIRSRRALNGKTPVPGAAEEVRR